MTDATTARRSHSIRSAVVTAITLWFPLLGGIVAWAVHLVFLAAFVQYSCNQPDREWVMHAVTAVTIAVTVAAIVLARRLASIDQDDSRGLRFLGSLALLIGAISFALIALEEIYVVAFHSRRCG